VIFALPGLILLGLSIVAFFVSLSPFYCSPCRCTGCCQQCSCSPFDGVRAGKVQPQQGAWDAAGPEFVSPVSPGPSGARHVEVKIVE
jgi:hypothetical protein